MSGGGGVKEKRRGVDKEVPRRRNVYGERRCFAATLGVTVHTATKKNSFPRGRVGSDGYPRFLRSVRASEATGREASREECGRSRVRGVLARRLATCLGLDSCGVALFACTVKRRRPISSNAPRLLGSGRFRFRRRSFWRNPRGGARLAGPGPCACAGCVCK